MKKSLSALTETYEKQFAYRSKELNTAPDPKLGLTAVIPCFNEPELSRTLSSLSQCRPPKVATEVLVVVNHSESAPAEIARQSERVLEEIAAFRKKNPFFSLFPIDARNLNSKDAGVGSARKIGMDEALRRFAEAGTDGLILCPDADCEVSENYFTEAEKALGRPDFKAGHYGFTHLVPKDKTLASGIWQYELHLRYYTEALKKSKYPKSFHTIGSCMAVRASAYARVCGMNKRKAGEDFYFMHRLAHFCTIETLEARVFPSARLSDRVPFGTGRAQQNFINSEKADLLSYDLKCFEPLAELCSLSDAFFESNDTITKCSTELNAFLEVSNFEKMLLKIRRQSKNSEQFRKQFFTYWDGFRALKMIHFMTEHFFPKKKLTDVAASLIEFDGESDAETLCRVYRKHQERF